MAEFLTVLGIYLAVSFLGMAILWTVAARRGAVRAPSYFFWMRVKRGRLSAAYQAGGPNIFNFSPLGLAPAAVVVLYAVSTSQLLVQAGWATGMKPNQTAQANCSIGS